MKNRVRVLLVLALIVVLSWQMTQSIASQGATSPSFNDADFDLDVTYTTEQEVTSFVGMIADIVVPTGGDQMFGFLFVKPSVTFLSARLGSTANSDVAFGLSFQEPNREWLSLQTRGRAAASESDFEFGRTFEQPPSDLAPIPPPPTPRPLSPTPTNTPIVEASDTPSNASPAPTATLTPSLTDPVIVDETVSNDAVPAPTPPVLSESSGGIFSAIGGIIGAVLAIVAASLVKNLTGRIMPDRKNRLTWRFIILVIVIFFVLVIISERLA